MKNLIWYTCVFLVLTSCTSEAVIEPENSALKAASEIKDSKVVICHQGHSLSVNENALNTHLDHGDALGDCVSGLTYVPDDRFEKALIKLGYDDVEDDYVLTASIAAVKSIYLSEKGIEDLTGIEGFSSLSVLYLEGNPVKSIDIRKNISLEELWIRNNELTSLDVTNNINLKALRCNENRLTRLDLSSNSKLEVFNCVFNEISELDTSHLTNLKELSCGSNNLTELDVSLNVNLEILDFADNLLTAIDLAANPELNTLYCFRNPMKSIDVSANQKLEYLACFNTEIRKLSLCGNQQLLFLQCQNNPFLSSLTFKTGSNSSITNPGNSFIANNNPNLYCIEVDDANYSNSNWINLDPWAAFSENCGK